MWRILNKLFGWDYILWENTCCSGIARVYKDRDGQLYYWRYRVTKVADKLDKPSDAKLWLTCKSEKYFK